MDWAVNRHQQWQPILGEHSINKQFSDTICFYGQLDRVDQQQDKLAVIDYKTGNVASGKSVLNGETVQLPFYSLLDKRIWRSEYVALGKREQVRSVAVIEDMQLEQLQTDHLQRLQLIDQQLRQEHEMPANGDQESCEYCNYQGMCRKSHWGYSASTK